MNALHPEEWQAKPVATRYAFWPNGDSSFHAQQHRLSLEVKPVSISRLVRINEQVDSILRESMTAIDAQRQRASHVISGALQDSVRNPGHEIRLLFANQERVSKSGIKHNWKSTQASWDRRLPVRYETCPEDELIRAGSNRQAVWSKQNRAVGQVQIGWS